MDVTQRDSILQLCKQFNSLAIEDSFTEAYKDNENISQVQIEGQDISFWVSTLKNIFAQFKSELETDNYFFLPFTCSLLRGEGDAVQSMTQIIGKITEKQPINDIMNQVYWLVEYQIRWGFWNKSQLKVHDVNAIELKKSSDTISLMKSELDQERKRVEQLKSEVLEEKNQIIIQRQEAQAFYDQKQNELKAIAETLAAVSGQKAEIDNSYKSVMNSDNEIRTKFQNQEELMTQLKTQKETQEKDFKNLLLLIEEEKGKLDKTLVDSDLKIKFFEGLENFIKEKQAEIIDLGALAAGAALGGTFGLREKSIAGDLKSWKGWIPWATAGAMLWVLIVFTCLKQVSDNIWIETVLKLAKTIPAFVLMGFVFKQYSKERNLREEYAFKAAVANTIKAYSDLLKLEDSEPNKSKQAMLLEAIKQVQTPPKLYSESGGKMFSFSTKNLAEAVKQLNESIKNIKPGA